MIIASEQIRNLKHKYFFDKPEAEVAAWENTTTQIRTGDLHQLITTAECLQELVEELTNTFERYSKMPERIQDVMRLNGIKIDNLEDPMQKFAFTLYNAIVTLALEAEQLTEVLRNEEQ